MRCIPFKLTLQVAVLEGILFFKFQVILFQQSIWKDFPCPYSLRIHLLFSKNNNSNTGWPLGATPFVLVKLMFFSSKCMCTYKKFSIFHSKYVKSAILFAQRKCSCMLSDRKYTTAKFYPVSPVGRRGALL